MELIGNCVCDITVGNIRILDSYKITSKPEMVEILYSIQHNHPECKVFKRSYTSLVREWRTHNLLYKLGLFKSHTKDTDLNYPIKWYEEFIYSILGL